jgi:hypothetical protein
MVLCPALLLCASCGGPSRSGQSTGPDRPRDAGSSQRGDGSAERGTPADVTAADKPAPSLSRAECETLFDHFMELAVQAHAGTVTPELQPTPEQVAEIRADMRPGFIAACLKFDRATYDCAIKAELRDQLMRCGAPASSTRRHRASHAGTAVSSEVSTPIPVPTSPGTPLPRS